MTCVECGAETAQVVQVCAVCGAPPVGASPTVAEAPAPGSGYRSRPEVRRNSQLPFRPPRSYLLSLVSCLVLFIAAVIGINKAPPRSGLSYTMGWTIVLSLLGVLLSLVFFSRARRSIRLQQDAVRARTNDILKVLEKRGLRPTKQQRGLVGSSNDLVQLERWFDRSLTAATADEIFKD